MVTKEEDVIVAPKDNLEQTLIPDSTIHASPIDQEVNTPVVPEKPSEDGYNWRKYGQKNVKGNEYIRSYYKCSYPNCLVKKQVERSQDGRITDITYLGKHEHPKPHSESQAALPSLLSVQVKTPDCPSSAVDEDKSSDAHASATDCAQPMDACEAPTVGISADTTPAPPLLPSSQARDDQNENVIAKRRKRSVDGADITVEKPSHDSRLVIQTVSEVDIVNDGYRWRKYGQKMVKGNPNPRSYYRCSTAGCPVKKHVERASYDPKVVITTYEGQHDHTVPPLRTVVPQTTPSSASEMPSNGVNKSNSEETDATAQNGAVPKAENPDVMETKAANVVRTEAQIIPNDQKSEHIVDQMAKEKVNEEEVETKPEVTQKKRENSNPICTVSSSDNIDRIIEEEKANVKPEVVSTEQQQKPNVIIDSSCPKEKSNGQQRMESEPESANC